MSCTRIDEDLPGIVGGDARAELAAHVAGCDACRDAKHALVRAARAVERAGDDWRADAELAARVGARAADAAGHASHARVRTERAGDLAALTPAGAPAHAPRAPFARRARLALFGALAVVGISAGIAAGLEAAAWHRSPRAAASRAWHGKVSKVARGGADASGGLNARRADGRVVALAEGAPVEAGWHVLTDARTRARLDLDDGTTIVLDRASDLELGESPRTATLRDGSIVADVAHLEGAPSARFTAPVGAVEVLGTKLALTATADHASVEVLRGVVAVTDATGARAEVAAGQEAELARGAKMDVAPANDLAQRAAFGEMGLDLSHNEDLDGQVSGLGELRAKRPGAAQEKDHAVRLARHGAKIRVVGNVARTEVDEVFTNDTDDVLEGIYRFPLPPGAQIERLALEVDGKLVDGEFVERDKAAKIWRGAIQHATPNAPKPREEIVWVPGPWRDPALLEWQRGGRFELRIFPIPKRGSRRVVLAYTETIAPVGGVRRYTYPLPQSTASAMKIDAFTIDAQVLGADPSTPVRAKGYELEHTRDDAAPGTDRFAQTMTSFTPSGDLTIEYRLADRATDASVFAYADATKSGEDGFVELALRPKLPKWTDVTRRDQVIVVDAGRAAFGERFTRARQLATQIVQEMDRRDRVTILACDTSCRAMPGGWRAPGAGAAHDADAFFRGISPDGASDLVEAVRSGARVAGHDADRDLRVVLVTAGAPNAGYARLDRVAAEVKDALPDARAEVVTVPIGQDADTAMLAEIARGGGGVLVPYPPGERLESAALDVLGATYGTTLRDVALTLPDGLREAAPSVVAPIRAGEERLVLARVKGDHVQGDVVLTGNVGGEPFTAKYPIDVRVTGDAGNAFVPRLYAAARIADEERDGGERARAELVALSRRFAVPSRFTSLLVLESEAMFHAFGIARADRAATWTGESAASGTTVDTAGKDAAGDDAYGAMALFGGAGGGGATSGGGAAHKSAARAPRMRAEDVSDPFADAPAPAPAAPSEASLPAPAATMAPAPVARAALPPPPWGWRRPGRFMKKVWFRRAQISADASPAIALDKVVAARAALAAAPDERGRTKDLARLLAENGQLDELGDVLAKWTARDPLDADAIAARADLLARQGERAAALRVLDGALASPALAPNDAAALASTLAAAHERAGQTDAACALRVSAAELRPADAEAAARAALCERARGRGASADRWLEAPKDDAARRALSAAQAKLARDAGKPESATRGDFVLTAQWDPSAGVDLDVALVDPSGARVSWASRARGVRAADATSAARESLAVSAPGTGPFVVEIARASGAHGPAVSGTLSLRALGDARTVPFTLPAGAARAQLARVDVRMEAELVPVDDVADDAVLSGAPPFNRALVLDALNVASSRARTCGAENGPTGNGRAQITFAPTGRVSNVTLDGTFAGTPTGVCVTSRLRAAAIPPFSGTAVTVAKAFTVDASF